MRTAGLVFIIAGAVVIYWTLRKQPIEAAKNAGAGAGAEKAR